MRQRKIKDIDKKLAGFDGLTVANPAAYKGRWKELFGNDGPVYLEIGCGKGQFITNQALRFPGRNFVAIEGHTSVVLRALQKTDEKQIVNIRFVVEYVKNIRDFFAEKELAGIYLNFSDPWPKDRHAKRRLTYAKRLLAYQQVVEEGGFIQFKTDNEGLFEFTLEQIEKTGMKIEEMSRDLHNSQYAEDNITTEYEDKFAMTGKNINYVKIKTE